MMNIFRPFRLPISSIYRVNVRRNTKKLRLNQIYLNKLFSHDDRNSL